MEIDFFEYIVKEAYVLIPALYVIGYLLKKTPKIPDWSIPWVLVVLGIGGGLVLAGVSVAGAIQGLLVAGFTVLSNQLYKQTTKVVEAKKTKKEADTDEKE